MIKADFPEGSDRSVGRDMATDPDLVPVGTHNHRHGIPADDRFDPSFNFAITRVDRLLVSGDGVDIWGVSGKGNADSLFLSPDLQ